MLNVHRLLPNWHYVFSAANLLFGVIYFLSCIVATLTQGLVEIGTASAFDARFEVTPKPFGRTKVWATACSNLALDDFNIAKVIEQDREI